MGIMDAFSKEDRVEITVNQLITVLRSDALNYSQNQVLINGLQAGINHRDILIMAGEITPAEDDTAGVCGEVEA